MLQTSGLLLTQNQDGSILVEYEDYDTPLGGDYSSMYYINSTNAQLLKKAMKRMHPLLSLKKALIREVGKNLDDSKFARLMDKLGVKYDHSTWRS